MGTPSRSPKTSSQSIDPVQTVGPTLAKHSRTQRRSETLILDAQTLADLEVFESTSNRSLFQLCNLTRTKGGKYALKKRMESPSSNSENIHAVQTSLKFIIQQREAFSTLPNTHIISNVERYRVAPLPVVRAQSSIEFAFSALSLWANNFNHFFSIWKGVSQTCTFIYNVRRFLKQSSTNQASGELANLITKLKTLLEAPAIARIPDKEYGIELRQVWRVLRFDQSFRITEVETLDKILAVTYDIEALVAMADCTFKHKFTFPEVVEGPLVIDAEKLVHPYVSEAVPNPVQLDDQHRGLFLTGPNMAGKTTYLRAFATAIYFAHLGMGVPAKSFRFTPVEQLISSISLSDNLHDGISYFRAEALRIKEIAHSLVQGDRVIAIMDEPFKGTNVRDTLEASLATLEGFLKRNNFRFMFSSHQIELADRLTGPIDCRYFAAIESETRLRFDYLLRDGVATQRIGMRVLKEEGVFDLLDQYPS